MQDFIAQQVKATVRQIDPQAEVILFGSRARGDARKDSDWDFLVLTTLKESADTDRLFWNALLEVRIAEASSYHCSNSCITSEAKPTT